MLERGTVQLVSVEQGGDELAADAASGATTLVVKDAADFVDPLVTGGTLFIGSDTLVYTEVDDDTSTITLSPGTPTTAAYTAGEPVYLNSHEVLARVELGDTGEAADAWVTSALISQLGENVYDELNQKSVDLEYDDDEDRYYILGINEELPVIDGGFIDPDTLPDPTPNDGDPPLLAPTFRVVPGNGLIFVIIDGIVNPDSVHYRIYCASSDVGTPTAADILVDETSAGVTTTRHLPPDAMGNKPKFEYYILDANGNETDQPQLYYFWVQAWEDIDGDGPISSPVTGYMDKTQGLDMAFRSLVGEHFASETSITSRLGVPSLTGERVEIYQGIKGYNSAEDITFKASIDGTPHYMRGEAYMEALTVQDKFALSGSDNAILSGSTLWLRGSTQDPKAKPAASMSTWPVKALSFDVIPSGKRGLHYVSAQFTVTNKALTSNVATLTIGTHTLLVGHSVTVAGVDATFNGTFTVTAVTATTVSYAKTASNVASTASGGTVTASFHDHFFYLTTDGNSSSIDEIDSNGNHITAYAVKNTGGGNIEGNGGVVRLGSVWYVLADLGGNDWRVYRYTTLVPLTNNSAAGFWDYTNESGSDTTPAIGANVADNKIMIARANASNQFRVREYDPVTGSLDNSILCADSPGDINLTGVQRVTDWLWPGETMYVLMPKSQGHVYVYGTAGARNSNKEWDTANDADTAGFAFNGTNFFHISLDGSFLTQYTRNFWTTQSSSWSVASTWGDSNAAGTGVHESGPSPFRVFTAQKCARLTLTGSSIPGGGGTDDPNRQYFYIGRGSVSNATMFRQTDPAVGVISANYDEVVFSGDNLGSRDTAFPAAAASNVKDDAGTILLSSDGSRGTFQTGDYKWVGYAVSGGGVVVNNAWVSGDASQVSRTGATFGGLFAVIGTSYGNGNGSSTFNVPDGRNRTLFGVGSNVALAANDGNTEANRGPRHTHAITSAGIHNHGGSTGGNNASAVDRTLGGVGTAAQGHTHAMSDSSSHDHTGSTGNGAAAAEILGSLGAHLLIKL